MVAISALAPPWMPVELIDVWYQEFLSLGGSSVPGSAENAAEIIRQDPKYRKQYDSYFPGNRRDDGSLRLYEEAYRSRIQGYENALLGVGVNPERFSDKFPGLISGDVTITELTNRVEDRYERIKDGLTEIRDYYAANFAMDMTDSAIVASFLDPDIGDAILERRIAISEIGGEAAIRGFGLELEASRSLQQAGVSRPDAQNLFGQAATDVPVLDVLARRHNDPDDDFDIFEFTRASVFDDPEERRRMRRLIAQERASFIGGAAGIGFTENESRGIVGLRTR